MIHSDALVSRQKELVATLVSSPVEAPDLRSAVYELLGKDEEKMKAVDG